MIVQTQRGAAHIIFIEKKKKKWIIHSKFGSLHLAEITRFIVLWIYKKPIAVFFPGKALVHSPAYNVSVPAILLTFYLLILSYFPAQVIKMKSNAWLPSAISSNPSAFKQYSLWWISFSFAWGVKWCKVSWPQISMCNNSPSLFPRYNIFSKF